MSGSFIWSSFATDQNNILPKIIGLGDSGSKIPLSTSVAVENTFKTKKKQAENIIAVFKCFACVHLMPFLASFKKYQRRNIDN